MDNLICDGIVGEDGDEHINVDNVAEEVIVDGIGSDFELVKKRTYAASTLRTTDYLKVKPRLYVGPGRPTGARLEEEREEDPPNLCDPDGNTATPSMKGLFRLYSDATIRKTENFLQSSSVEVEPSNVVREEEEEVQEMVHQNEEVVVEEMDQLNAEEAHSLDQETTIEEMKRDIYYNIDERGDEYELSDMDCPRYSDVPIDFAEACDIVMGNIRVSDDKICKLTPHGFKGIGTFIVDLSSFDNRHDVIFDGLGSWGKPSGRTKFYQLLGNKYVCVSDTRGQLPKNVEYDVKCQLKKYEHPSTVAINDGANRFVKKIITALSSNQQHYSIAVVTYEWIGTPFEFSLIEGIDARRSRNMAPLPPDGSRSWEAASFQTSGFGSFPTSCTAMMGDCQLYSMGAIQFQDAANIILGATNVDGSKICDRVPQRFREAGTFIVDVHSLITEQELRRDDNGQWGKPAGSSRYFKYVITNGQTTASRVDRCGRVDQGETYDIQILCKRYEHPLTDNRFVRKIYTGRTPMDRGYIQASQLAVITYFWKGEPIPFEILPQRKVRVNGSSDYEISKRDGGTFYDYDMGDELLGINGDTAMYLESNPGVSEEAIPVGMQEPNRKRKKESHPSEHQRSSSTQSDNPVQANDGDVQTAKLAYMNQQRFAMILDRFEGIAEKMERMTELQMNMMWHQQQQQQQQSDIGVRYNNEGGEGNGDGREVEMDTRIQYVEEEVYEMVDENNQ